MSTKEKPPLLPVAKLITLNKGLRLAENWVDNMHGGAREEAGEMEMEGRPAGQLHKKLAVGRKKPSDDDEEIMLSTSNGLGDDSDDDEYLDSRTNAFASKRLTQTTKHQAKKKQNW